MHGYVYVSTSTRNKTSIEYIFDFCYCFVCARSAHRYKLTRTQYGFDPYPDHKCVHSVCIFILYLLFSSCTIEKRRTNERINIFEQDAFYLFSNLSRTMNINLLLAIWLTVTIFMFQESNSKRERENSCRFK